MLARSAAQNSHSDAAQKHLETQHWLELIDGQVFLVHGTVTYIELTYARSKHRYGSNCTSTARDMGAC